MDEVVKRKEDLHKAILDEYFSNGFVGYKAVMAFKPDITKAQASGGFNNIYRENKSYVTDRLTVLRAEAQIDAVQLLRELINFSFSDVTDYLDLTAKELKALPPDLRRCIASLESKTRSFTDRGGKKVKETTYKIKLVDKLVAMEKINKHMGFYSEDNKQKATKINLTNLPKATLNVLLQNIVAGT